MSVNDPGKMLLLSIGLVGGFLTLFAGIIVKDSGATAAGLTIVSLILGYLTGNGVLARSGKAPEPAIRSARQQLPGDELPLNAKNLSDVEDEREHAAVDP